MLYKWLFCLSLGLPICLPAQKVDEQLKEQILAEGFELFHLELAAWQGTERAIRNLDGNQDQVGGYFAYPTEAGIRMIFHDGQSPPMILATIDFDAEASPGSLRDDYTPRPATERERLLAKVRQSTVDRLESDPGELYKVYQHTGMNIAILEQKKGFKAYIMNAPKVEGVVLIGNDYLLTFNRKGRFKSEEALHQSLIQLETSPEGQDSVVASMHTHVLPDQPYITPTDICTLLLYSQFTNWEKHHVVSEEFHSIWDIRKETLTILSREALGRILETEGENKE